MAKLLIVDDDARIRSTLRELLRLHGHEVIGEASDGAEALRLLDDRCSPDVVLLDLEMPVMSGWAFLRATTDAAIPPIIVISSLYRVVPPSPQVFAAVDKGADAGELSRLIEQAAARSASPSRTVS